MRQGDEATGRAVRYLRVRRNLRLSDLAAMTGIHDSVLSRIENGIRPIPEDSKPELFKALGVTADQFGRERRKIAKEGGEGCGGGRGGSQGVRGAAVSNA